MKKSEDKRIVKSNVLIDGKHIHLSVIEIKLLLLCIREIQKGDEVSKKYRIYLKDYLGMKTDTSTNIYTQSRHYTKELLSRVIEIEDKKSLLQTHILSSVWYEKEGEEEYKGYFDFTFSPEITPHLFDIKNRFTAYEIENVINLKSIYSIRLYEILKSFEGLGKRTISLDDLRWMLNVENKYPLFSEFNKYILKKSHKEMKKTCKDIYFDYIPQRKGRSVNRVLFFIKKKRQQSFDFHIPTENIDDMKKVEVVSSEEIQKGKEILKKGFLDKTSISPQGDEFRHTPFPYPS